ncbi:MAG: tagaturonate reductase [Pedobacter sp.]|nr:tagaturonate reductase [Pedobacter sp.]MDQ8051484.1 tagaturonate reductase [Pedobacter sp.]
MILSRENLDAIAKTGIDVPQAATFELPEKVLQFGTGVLLRGLPDYFINKANNQGVFNGRVVVVKSTGTSTVEFDQQDSLYTLCIRGIENGQPVSQNIISSAISRVIAADRDWKSILSLAESPSLQLVVSNTTEVGIQLVEESIQLQPPTSFPAKLLAVLHHRYHFFKGSATAGLVIVATELIPDNGKRLKEIILELSNFNQLGDEFLSWLESSNHFCNSLVDRIVPGKPDANSLAALQEELGYTDHLLSMSEPYRLWAIEGNEQVAAILSFAKADPGVVIAEDIEIYRELKVRLLNGTHTLSSGIAFLSAIDTVKNAMQNAQVKSYIETLMGEEIAPSIPYAVTEQQASAFADTVKDRFANPSIEHLWLNITFQYSMKMKIRILPLLLNYVRLFNQVPAYIAFGFAAYLRFMKIEHTADGKYVGSYQGRDYQVTDDSAPYFDEKIRQDPQDYPISVLKDADFWKTDLTLCSGFVETVVEKYQEIESAGIERALSALQSAKLEQDHTI